MIRFLLRRISTIILSLFFVITITFFLMKAIPGGPFTTDKKLPVAIQQNIEEKYHLNDPLWKQYTDYLNSTIHGDLGPSFKYEDRTVKSIIAESFPVSAALGGGAVFISLFFGLLAGIISALKQNKWQDYTAMILSTVGFSVPNFIIAGLLMYVFALKLRWFPAAMWGTPEQMVLPTIALSLLPMASIARLMRSSMVEVLGQDYIKTAKAKGLNQRVVIYRHAMRNAILPVVTYLGPLVAAILTGSFIIEFIFAIPGLGRWFVTSISNRDYTVIIGTTIFYSVLLMIMNLIVDIAYAFIDPRIKVSGGKGGGD